VLYYVYLVFPIQYSSFYVNSNNKQNDVIIKHILKYMYTQREKSFVSAYFMRQILVQVGEKIYREYQCFVC